MLDSLTIPRFDVWRQTSWRMKPVRFKPDCCIIARLKIIDKEFWIDGAVLSLTRRMALFREASTYMLARRNEEIVLDIESAEYPARIVATERHGYRLTFFETLPDILVTDLRERWRIED